MQLDKKLITIIISSAFVGGIIGGGIGGALGSFTSQEEGGRHYEPRDMERNDKQDNYSDGETNDDTGIAPQTGQVVNLTQVPDVTASTTKAK
jgi:hypothetical protein